MLNKLDEFEDAVRKAVSDVRLDNDVVVSVFETNIRVLGCETFHVVDCSCFTRSPANCVSSPPGGFWEPT